MRMENKFSVGSKYKVKTDKPTIIRAGLLECTKSALDHLTLLRNSFKLIGDILQYKNKAKWIVRWEIKF